MSTLTDVDLSLLAELEPDDILALTDTEDADLGYSTGEWRAGRSIVFPIERRGVAVRVVRCSDRQLLGRLAAAHLCPGDTLTVHIHRGVVR